MKCVKKLIIILGLLPLLYISLQSSGANIDSLLLHIQKTTSDSERVVINNDIAWELMFNDPDSALQYAKAAYNDLQHFATPQLLSDSYNTLASIYYLKANYEQSKFYCILALIVRSASNDQRGLMSSWNNLGNTLKELGQYKNELQCYYKALAYASAVNDTFTAMRISMNAADAYKRLNQFDIATHTIKDALQIALRFNNNKQLGIIYLNLMSTYIEMNQLDSAEHYLPYASEYVLNYGDKYILSKYYNALSNLYKDPHRIELAIENAKKAIFINKEIKNNNSLATNLVNLGSCYESIGQFNKAYDYYTQALSISKGLRTLQWMRQSYYGVATTSAALKKYEQAYSNLLQYISLDDSLRGDKIQHEFAELKILYETALKDNQIVQLQADNDKSLLAIRESELKSDRKSFIITFISSIIVILLLAYAAKLRSLKYKRETENVILKQQVREEERVRLAKDIHDELGSGLTRVRYILELLSKGPLVQEQRQHLITMQQTTSQIVDNMRDLIWAVNPDNTTLLGLTSRIREYCSDYTEDLSLDIEYHIDEDIPEHRISSEVHRNVMMIVKEIIQNIVKHAQASRIIIRIASDKNEFMLQFVDNGKGFTQTNITGGSGLKNIKQRAIRMGAVCILDSIPEKGTSITIHLPINKLTTT